MTGEQSMQRARELVATWPEPTAEQAAELRRLIAPVRRRALAG